MIKLESDKVIITDWTIDDPEVVHFLRQGSKYNGTNAEAPEKILLNAMKIGLLALQQTQTHVDVDIVRHEFKALRQQFKEDLEDIFREDNGRLALTLTEYLGQNGKLADLFDPQRRDSAIGHIQTIFDKHFDGDGAKFQLLLDYTTEGSPLTKLHRAIEDKFKTLDERLINLDKALAIEAGQTEVYEQGTQKGLDFEVIVQNCLNPIARSYKDNVTLVGQEQGIQNKKGDLLVEISLDEVDAQNSLYMVIECKREQKDIGGKNGILQELDQAMSNREAQFGLAVFSEDACPSEVGRLRLYPRNRLICAIPADGSDSFILEAAYQIARTELYRQHHNHGGEIDRAAVSTAIKRVEEKIDQFKGLKGKATELEKITKDIRNQLDTIEDDIKGELQAVLTKLVTDEDELTNEFA